MFRQTWKKYLPIIVFLMKRSAKGAQALDMNFTDFEKACGGKKIKFSFSNIVLSNGRSDTDQKHSILVSDLILVLQENKESVSMMTSKQFEFAMNSDFQLTIKNVTPYLGT
jgi:hypothetical protein